MMTDDKDPQAAITTRIGLVAAGWARFEYKTNQMLWHLANVDIEAGACITAQIQSQPNRLRALCALVAFRAGEGHPLIGDINKFSARAEKLARQRNRYIHDPWIYMTDGRPPIRVEVTADRKLQYATVETSLQEMDNLIGEIQSAMEEIDRLYTRIANELTWPDTQFSQSMGRDPTLMYTNRNGGA
jgi:hypothetical protein